VFAFSPTRNWQLAGESRAPKGRLRAWPAGKLERWQAGKLVGAEDKQPRRYTAAAWRLAKSCLGETFFPLQQGRPQRSLGVVSLSQ